MGTNDLSNTELLVLTIVQETSLSVEKAGVLFERFQEDYELNKAKMTQAAVRRWILRQGVEITRT